MELIATEGATMKKKLSIPSNGEGENGEHIEFSHTTGGVQTGTISLETFGNIY